ncbi:MAG: hypothetical protein IPM54_25475 [Polyangiaceae bacterium]|nr:hypothetical protein [Polyangiaceae bacterium]
MKRYLYVVWFRNTDMPPDDQDYEWPACFLVEALAANDALSWGDQLATDYSKRRGTEVFLKSYLDVDAEGDLSQLPVVQVGYKASDEEIGW